jgi:hypothetical protein
MCCEFVRVVPVCKLVAAVWMCGESAVTVRACCEVCELVVNRCEPVEAVCECALEVCELVLKLCGMVVPL